MLNIIYSDPHIAVCEKPAGVAVEGGKGQSTVQLLAAQLGGDIFPVHRLDQPVGGLLAVARTAPAAAALSRQMAESPCANGAAGFDKRYLAVVAGPLQPAAGTLRHLLYHDARANKTYAVKKERKGVKEAVLEYETLATADDLALVRVHLLTGRTHQIRAQFAAEGHPLAGDGRYGSRCKGAVALFSAQLAFDHPVTGQRLQFAALPDRSTGFWQVFGPGVWEKMQK